MSRNRLWNWQARQRRRSGRINLINMRVCIFIFYTYSRMFSVNLLSFHRKFPQIKYFPTAVSKKPFLRPLKISIRFSNSLMINFCFCHVTDKIMIIKKHINILTFWMINPHTSLVLLPCSTFLKIKVVVNCTAKKT